jgi:hypothetical protein
VISPSVISDQVEEDEMDGACSKIGEQRNVNSLLMEKPEESH